MYTPNEVCRLYKRQALMELWFLVLHCNIYTKKKNCLEHNQKYLVNHFEKKKSTKIEIQFVFVEFDSVENNPILHRSINDPGPVDIQI